jgi:hypothetical protein
MQLIKPKQISGEIMTLFEEAEERVIIVSPYYKIAKWYKLLNCFEDLRRRNIDVEFYVREKEWESINELQAIGVNPACIPNLHTKLYMNEKTGIVSSMNMLLSSDTNSLDIALKTKTDQEYQELFDYYKRYIRGSATTNATENNQGSYDWFMDLDFRLSEVLGSRVNLSFQDEKLQITGRNKYEAFICNGKSNDLRISGILSNKEFLYVQNNSGLFSGKRMSMELIAGSRGYYDTIWGTVKNYKTYSLQDIRQDEEQDIVEIITKFVSAIEQLKTIVR